MHKKTLHDSIVEFNEAYDLYILSLKSENNILGKMFAFIIKTLEKYQL